MENQIVLLDTSILIDYYRKKDKSKTALIQIYQSYPIFAVSVITQYEIYVGAYINQIDFWDNFFSGIIIHPFDSEVSKTAVNIRTELKKNNKQIDIADLLIAATAITHNLPCATFNRNHFERIKQLEVVDF